MKGQYGQFDFNEDAMKYLKLCLGCELIAASTVREMIRLQRLAFYIEPSKYRCRRRVGIPLSSCKMNAAAAIKVRRGTALSSTVRRVHDLISTGSKPSLVWRQSWSRSLASELEQRKSAAVSQGAIGYH